MMCMRWRLVLGCERIVRGHVLVFGWVLCGVVVLVVPFSELR